MHPTLSVAEIKLMYTVGFGGGGGGGWQQHSAGVYGMNLSTAKLGIQMEKQEDKPIKMVFMLTAWSHGTD
jgi:hypothetical protein